MYYQNQSRSKRWQSLLCSIGIFMTKKSSRKYWRGLLDVCTFTIGNNVLILEIVKKKERKQPFNLNLLIKLNKVMLDEVGEQRYHSSNTP